MTLWQEKEVKGCDYCTWTALAESVRGLVLFARKNTPDAFKPFPSDELPEGSAWLDTIAGEQQPRQDKPAPLPETSRNRFSVLLLLYDLWNESFLSFTSEHQDLEPLTVSAGSHHWNISHFPLLPSFGKPALSLFTRCLKSPSLTHRTYTAEPDLFAAQRWLLWHAVLCCAAR